MFCVWAPRAKAVSVVGDFNDWKPGAHPMTNHDDSGVWTCFIPGIQKFDVYKYCVTTPDGDLVFKTDPYGLHFETRPSNGAMNGTTPHGRKRRRRRTRSPAR